jgi:hypothetical protein
MRSNQPSWPAAAILAALAIAAAVAGVAVTRSGRAEPPAAQPARVPSVWAQPLARPSDEERFLAHAVRLRPREPLEIDPRSPRTEARRVLPELRELFLRMEALAAELGDSDRARYAAEMERLKARLVALLDAAKRIVREADGARELLDLLAAETDRVLKRRFSVLFRYTHRDTLGPFLLALAHSGDAGDRGLAIEGLGELRTVEAVSSLSARADTDPDIGLRQRAILGLGKSLGGASRASSQYRETALREIRKYAQPSSLPALRAAAFEALRLPALLSKTDRDLITTAYSTEPWTGSAVCDAIQRAYADMAHRRKHR